MCVELVCERAVKLLVYEREGIHVNIHPRQHHLVVKQVAVIEVGGQALHNAAGVVVRGSAVKRWRKADLLVPATTDRWIANTSRAPFNSQ